MNLEHAMEEAKTFLRYAVPKSYEDAAIQLLAVFENDEVGMGVLLDFYQRLPDAMEDGVREIRCLGKSQGIFLLAAQTYLERCYLYLGSLDEVRFAGSADECAADSDMFTFFNVKPPGDSQALINMVADATAYIPAQEDPDQCPICKTASGEKHFFGCPVEVCPWCQGQLTRCGCSFKKLKTDTITTKKQCDRLLDILEKKGRIPFNPKQRPGYPAHIP